MKFRVVSTFAGLVMMSANVSLAQSLGDAAAGKQRATVCIACHGVDGVSKIPETPHLAGQDIRYLEQALRAYRDGKRPDPAMRAMARPLSDKDIADLATYFHLAILGSSEKILSQAEKTQQQIKK